MPMSRALKDSMRGEGKFDGVAKRAGVSDSGKGPGMGMAKGQFTQTGKKYTGPNYPQATPGISTKGSLK